MIAQAAASPQFTLTEFKRGPLDGTRMHVDTLRLQYEFHINERDYIYTRVFNMDLRGQVEYHEQRELQRAERADANREVI